MRPASVSWVFGCRCRGGEQGGMGWRLRCAGQAAGTHRQKHGRSRSGQAEGRGGAAMRAGPAVVAAAMPAGRQHKSTGGEQVCLPRLMQTGPGRAGGWRVPPLAARSHPRQGGPPGTSGGGRGTPAAAAAPGSAGLRGGSAAAAIVIRQPRQRRQSDVRDRSRLTSDGEGSGAMLFDEHCGDITSSRRDTAT